MVIFMACFYYFFISNSKILIEKIKIFIIINRKIFYRYENTCWISEILLQKLQSIPNICIFACQYIKYLLKKLKYNE